MTELQASLDLESGIPLGVGDSIRYVGATYTRVASDTIECSIREYLEGKAEFGVVEDTEKFVKDFL